MLRPPNPDYKELLRTINVPSLLVFGDNGVISTAVAKELNECNPIFQLEQIGEAGHALHLDQPEHFAKVIKSFLRSVL